MKPRSFLLISLVLAPAAATAVQQQTFKPPTPAQREFVKPAPLKFYDFTGAPRFEYEHRFGLQYYQGDPADSLFRAAAAYFNRSDYRQAADRYSDVRAKYP